MARPVTLRLDAVSIRRGSRVVVDGFSLTAAPGELVAIMGASGTGKSSVLRAISGLDPLAAGEICIGDLRLTAGGIPRGERLMALHRAVGMVFQFHHLFSHITALQNVCLAPVRVLGQPHADVERRARTLLEELGVGHRADAMPHELSGGEAQRVAIARALAVDPPVLLLDEPTASLDEGRRRDLAATLVELSRQSRTVLVATHDADFVRACATRTVVLDATKIAVSPDA
jgi:ABC-type polar amino acid transport system ATPase subunit